jgi:hypothetical protein
MDIKELGSGVNPKIHWYYQTKKIPLYRFVKKIHSQFGKPLTIIDFGAGSGFFSFDLEEHHHEMVEKFFLVDIEYTDKELSDTKGQKIEKRREMPDNMEFAVVVMMDVLEHIEQDEAILNHIKSKCRHHCYFFITVPAFMSLWSGHDIYLGHYRRYRISTLGNLLKKVNFQIASISYLYGIIFPLVWAIRKIKRKSVSHSSMASINPMVNSILKFYGSAAMTVSRFNKLFGITCTAEGKIS